MQDVIYTYIKTCHQTRVKWCVDARCEIYTYKNVPPNMCL